MSKNKSGYSDHTRSHDRGGASSTDDVAELLELLSGHGRSIFVGVYRVQRTTPIAPAEPPPTITKS
jgi:hypothetical protein